MTNFIPDGEWRMEATDLGMGRYAVRPKGRLGTCGWIGERAWTVVYVKAASKSAAVSKATRKLIYGFKESK